MENLNKNIENHYLQEGLYEDIIHRIKEQNIALYSVKKIDIASLDLPHSNLII